MLLNGSEDKWSKAYQDARLTLSSFPAMVEKLDKIFRNPKYYAGYYLRNISCNMCLHGSVRAEINHSSICAHLGEGANWEITYQLMKLMQRATHNYLVYCKAEDSLNLNNEYYTSKMDGDLGIQDKLAKKALSSIAHSKGWTIAIRRADN